jgi:hypothetical protein
MHQHICFGLKWPSSGAHADFTLYVVVGQLLLLWVLLFVVKRRHTRVRVFAAFCGDLVTEFSLVLVRDSTGCVHVVESGSLCPVVGHLIYTEQQDAAI